MVTITIRIAMLGFGLSIVHVSADPLPRFPSGAVWNQEISSAAVYVDSATMIATLDSLGGFGGSTFRRMQIDFSLHVVHAEPGSPLRTVTAHSEGYYSPDCDALGGVGGRLYVRPATHAGGPSGPSGSIPYGARLRLRSDFPLDGYNAATRVILNTFKRYGIVLADGGNIALTAESDLYTTTKWSDLGINSRIFDQTPGALDVTINDFDVLDTGPRIAETWECVRSIISMPELFMDGFED